MVLECGALSRDGEEVLRPVFFTAAPAQRRGPHPELVEGRAELQASQETTGVIMASMPMVSIYPLLGQHYGLSRCARAGQRMRAVIPSFDLT